MFPFSSEGRLVKGPKGEAREKRPLPGFFLNVSGTAPGFPRSDDAGTVSANAPPGRGPRPTPGEVSSGPGIPRKGHF